MDEIESIYGRILATITDLLSPQGPLRERPEVALTIDASDLRLRSWKYEFDNVSDMDARLQLQDSFGPRLNQVSEILETLESLIAFIRDCACRA